MPGSHALQKRIYPSRYGMVQYRVDTVRHTACWSSEILLPSKTYTVSILPMPCWICPARVGWSALTDWLYWFALTAWLDWSNWPGMQTLNPGNRECLKECLRPNSPSKWNYSECPKCMNKWIWKASKCIMKSDGIITYIKQTAIFPSTQNFFFQSLNSRISHIERVR